MTLNSSLLTELLKERVIKLRCSHETAMTQLTSQTTCAPSILHQSHVSQNLGNAP